MTRLLSAGLLALSIGLIGLTAWPIVTAAADASPAPSVAALDDGLLESGDSRSEGEGPGLVGSPLSILFGVVVLGLTAAGVTVLVVRLRGDQS